MKKLAKAQMGKIIKTAAKTIGNYGPKATEVITKSVKPAVNASKSIYKKGAGDVAVRTGALLGGVGYLKYKKVIDRDQEKKSITTPKKKMGGSKKSC